MSNKLAAYVEINRQFLRSIRLDADYGRIDALQGYIVQPSAQALLDTTAKHLLNTQQRAFTWTGPYGGGKSSLALALASLAGGSSAVRKAAKDTLGLTAGEGVLKYFGGKSPWIVLPVVGKRASITTEIAAALDTVLPVRGPKPRTADGQRDVVAELVRAAETKEGIGGVLLVVDELGKFLEYAALKNEDIGFYQELAEAASRCDGNLVVIGVLHQAFEQYASRLGQATREEWAKVQGRYVDIPLVAGSDEVVSLIGRALNVTRRHGDSKKISDQVAKVIKKRRPSAARDIGELLDQCWPLHPVTAALLGPASKRRFGQNERSVFSFLASAEPLGFSEVLHGLDADQSSYYWPAQFWDYLKANFEPAILASPDGHRWAASAEAVERAEARFSRLHVSLVKTVGLIEILRNGSGLAAETELLSTCVNSSESKAVSVALDELSAASILIFRKHLDAWGVYAGSDFDIEAAVRSAKSKLGDGNLTQLSKLIELGPITARRHYWETGAMRWFSRAMLHEDEAAEYLSRFKTAGSQCGEFVLVLPKHRSESSDRNKVARKLSAAASENGLIVGVPTNADRIEDLVYNLAALEYVRENSRELDSDSIALREIVARMQAVRSSLSDELRDAFQNSTWYHDGHVKKHAHHDGLAKMASDIADTIFPNAPTVHSELVNRDVLSASAAKAQRELLHRMLQNSDQPELGYTTLSADAGLFRTVIKSLGFHHRGKGDTGLWHFTDPQGGQRSESVQALWAYTKELVFNSDGLIRLSDLYKAWTAPPFGVKAGLLPIFALAFFMAYRNQLALYIEGTFTSEVTDAHVDEWLQDPTRIEWRFVRIEATEKKMLQALAAALSKRLGMPVAADALDSARAMVGLVYGLPHWVRRTNLLSKETKDVRTLLLHASDPHKVLFADLPLILDTRSPSELAERIAHITGELVEAFEKRLREVEARLFNALDYSGDLSQLNERGLTVKGVGAEFRLDAFATRIGEYNGSLEDVEGLLMLAISKPSREWNDHDINAGEVQLISWAMEFRRLETLAAIRERPATRRAIGVVFGSQKTVTGTFDVSEKDNPAVQSLAKELLAKLATRDVKREVFLAAIAEVGATLFESLNADAEELKND